MMPPELELQIALCLIGTFFYKSVAFVNRLKGVAHEKHVCNKNHETSPQIFWTKNAIASPLILPLFPMLRTFSTSTKVLPT